MIEDILEEIYVGSVNYGIQDIIGGIDPLMGMEAGGTCTGWLGKGVLLKILYVGEVTFESIHGFKGDLIFLTGSS